MNPEQTIHASHDTRLAMVRAVAQELVSEGWAEIRAQACPEYRDPQPIVVPKLNELLQPDVCASHPARPAPLLACVGVADDLREAAVGRRWRALAAWAADRQAMFAIFVQPDDYPRACAFAARWRIDAEHLRALTSTH